jgi:hypothetical protein
MILSSVGEMESVLKVEVRSCHGRVVRRGSRGRGVGMPANIKPAPPMPSPQYCYRESLRLHKMAASTLAAFYNWILID